MSEILNRSLTEHADAMRRGEYSARELTALYLKQIERTDGKLSAYLTVCSEQALAAADRSDARRAAGRSLGVLDGIPFAAKDNICTKGIPTTCASRMLEGYCPPYDATVIERLSARGAVLLGKTNMDEFAMGSTGENSAFGVTHNPIDPARVAGGSSGGSAAAVAAKQAVFTLGTDTGGSIRQPSAFCGVVGIKPTYGRVSRYGLVAYASSLDQIGPITRTVADNATVLSAIAGYDDRDATADARGSEVFLPNGYEDVKGLKIGIVRQLSEEGISCEVRRAILEAAERFRGMGATVKEMSLPSLKDASAAYYVIASAEASSNLARFDGIRYGHRAEDADTLAELYRRSRTEGFGDEVKRRILLGTFVLSEGYADDYYRRAMQLRRAIRAELERAYDEVDLLLMPSAATVAYRIGEAVRLTDRYRDDLCGVVANLAGLPSISIPCGADENGLPIGLQLMGRAFDERTLYRAAYAYEREDKER